MMETEKEVNKGVIHRKEHLDRNNATMTFSRSYYHAPMTDHLPSHSESMLCDDRAIFPTMHDVAIAYYVNIEMDSKLLHFEINYWIHSSGLKRNKERKAEFMERAHGVAITLRGVNS